MKRALILGIIGSAAAVVTSFGQGGVTFGTYTSSGLIGNPITYANSGVPAGDAGLALGGDFSAELLYNNGSGYVAIPSSITAFYATDGDTADGAGYVVGSSVIVPNWSSGAVSFEMYAFNNTVIGGDAIGTIVGTSAPFTLTPVSPTTPSYPDFTSATGYAAFTVSAVPEPATMALVGLGAAGLLAFRRRKA
jgi:hypothetical protein